MSNIVKLQIADQERQLQVKEYQGKRVVTFKDIDSVHNRAEGTAKRNFNENKQHFIEGEDYFITTWKEFSTKFVPNPKGGNPNNEVIMLTESGYLMLVKSFTDDLAWQVQRQLVNVYFKVRENANGVKFTPQPRPRTRMISTAVRDVDATAKQMMKLFGVKDGIAYAAAMSMVETVYQIDMTPVKKLLPSVEHEIGRLNATEIADKMDIRYKTGSPDPKTINKMLVSAGLIVVTGDRKQPYALTDAGKDIGEIVPYTRGGHSGYEIRWSQSVIEMLEQSA